MAIRLSSLADYAVVLMRAAATHCGGARPSAADLAAETGLPVPTTQKLVSLLARAGLLRALRGSGGGVKLARPAAAISLADIIEAVEGPIALTPCSDAANHECLLEARCGVQPHWAPVNQAFKTALGSVSLAALIGERTAAPVAVGGLPRLGEAGPAVGAELLA